MNKMASALGALTLITVSTMSARSQSALPSHCKANEHAYLNAKMASIVRQKDGGYQLKAKNGKVLSICADKASEPFGKLVYRYGAPGKVELEHVATKALPFNIFTRSTTARTGENILSFSKNGYTYYVVEALGMGSGVSLMVYHKGKRVVDLFSGNEPGVDFEAGLLDLNFEKAASGIFRHKQPVDKF